MAKKKVNRKKLLKKQLLDLRKAGLALTSAVAEKTHEVVDQVVEATGKAVENVTERVREAADHLTHKAETSEEVAQETATEVVEEATPLVDKKVAEVKQSAGDFDSFAVELEGIATARLETFYAEGIQAKADFAKWTEKELLALKGIGPATIKQLKELGINIKA